MDLETKINNLRKGDFPHGHHRHPNYFSHLFEIFKKTAASWWKADPFRQSATVAYYAIFSIPALLVIVISFAGFVFGEEAVRGEINKQIGSMMGPDTAKAIEEVVAKTGESKRSVWAAVIGFAVLVFGATGVFTQLQIVLDMIWEVKPSAKKPLLKSLKDRLFSFGLILSIGFLLLVSLLLSTFLAAIGDKLMMSISESLVIAFKALNFVLSIGVITVLFALMYKILPDVKIKWRDIWVGALITALLFTLGKWGLAYYFGKAEPASAYGAAGSIVLMMLWVSYSSMIVFFGAEFTKQYSVHYGHDIIPVKDAVKIKVEPM
jgi:membrane protein